MKTTKHILISQETPWGQVEVWQDGGMRYLYIQDKIAIQSQIDMANKEKLVLEYSRAMMSFLLFQPDPQSILLFGLGGGSIIHFLCRWFPKLDITIVEINSKIPMIAKKYFKIPNSPQISIQISNTFSFFKRSRNRNYNVILFDIYLNGSPNSLCSSDFFKDCFNRLSFDGILVVNLLVNNDEEFLSILTTLRQWFKTISLCIPLKNEKNVLLFAFKALTALDMNQLHIKACELKRKYDIEFDQFIEGIIKIDAKLKTE